MNYTLISALILGLTTITSPVYAQFSSFSSGADSCSGVCVKLDFGSANNDNSFSNGFGGSSTTGNNNLRWQLGVTWRPSPPEISQVESERAKQRLDDNRTLMTSLAEAIAQNKTELARGLAILLAPRLGYSNPIVLLAEMKQGSVNTGVAQTEMPKGSTIFAPSTTQGQAGSTIFAPPTTQGQTGSTTFVPPTTQGQTGSTTDNQPIIELR